MAINEKKRIAIVISCNLFVRSYLTNDALDDIKENYDCSLIVSEDVTHRTQCDSWQETRFFKSAPEASGLHYKIFNLLLWKNRNIVSSFKFRLMRLFPAKLNLTFSSDKTLSQKAIRIPWRILVFCHGFLRKLLYCFLSSKPVFPWYFSFLTKRLPKNESLEKAVREAAPDLLLFPSSAYDPEGNDLIPIARSLNIPVCFLVDNWDNLSSKTILWRKPDFIATWGDQSCEHAVHIQGFEKKQVFKLGTPRFDQYFMLRDTDSLPPLFDFSYILFVGTALASNEAEALAVLNDIIERHQELFAGVKVLYRPHPWRQGADSILGKGLKHVMIDPQLQDAYASGRRDTDSVMPDLAYYPRLLQHTQFVMGGLTSMLIESLIFRKRFLALVHDDNELVSNQKNALHYFVHFKGLEQIDAVHFCHDIQNLEKEILRIWDLRNVLDKSRLDGQRRYFCYDDARAYKTRLADLCQKMLELSSIN